MKVNELFGAWITWNTDFIVNGEELSETELAKDERAVYEIELDVENGTTLLITTE